MKNLLKYFFVITVISFSFLLGAFFYLIDYDLVDFSVTQSVEQGKPSVVLDDKNEVLFTFKLDKREPILFKDVPRKLVNAFVAAEDWDFFSHCGVSFKGIFRSLAVNLYHRKIVQGASTITQQVAKLLFLSHDRTILRKLKDVFLSFQLERQFTKEQILELYLNNVYFGRGIYGVEAASQRFWGKSIKDLTLNEAATLAATAKSAFYFSPLNNLVNSLKRRNLVLKNMYKLCFISKRDLRKNLDTEIYVKDKFFGDPVLLYLQEWIRSWVEKKLGKDSLYTKGLKIKTTINMKQQKSATKIFRKKIEEIRSRLDDKLNGGMISIESSTGKIKSLIGGFDFNKSQFNRVLQAKRQIGSSFKPFLYAAAVKNGLDMDTVMVDEPIEMQIGGTTWKPKNWDGRFEGKMTLLRALTKSNNIIAIKTLLKLGYDKVINCAKRFQIKSGIQRYPSMALGTVEMTVKDLAGSFNVFANNGHYVKPYFIEWVKDLWGKKIWEVEREKILVLDSITNSKMINALSYRIKRAKDLLKYRYWIDAQAIGKTGSTNEATSTWFVGSTPELTTCVYIGRDDNKSVGRNVFASTTVFPIWLDFNMSLSFNKKLFYIDPSLNEVFINWNSGEKAKRKNKYSTVSILK